MSEPSSEPFSRIRMAKAVGVLDELRIAALEAAKPWLLIRNALGERPAGPGTRSIVHYGPASPVLGPGLPPDLTVSRAVPVVFGHLELRRSAELTWDQVRSLTDDETGAERQQVKDWIVATVKAANAALCIDLADRFDNPVEIGLVGTAGLVAAANAARPFLSNHHELDLLVDGTLYTQAAADTTLKAALRGGSVVPCSGPALGGHLGWLLRHGAGDATVVVAETLKLYWEPSGDVGITLILTEQFGLDTPARSVPAVLLHGPA